MNYISSIFKRSKLSFRDYNLIYFFFLLIPRYSDRLSSKRISCIIIKKVKLVYFEQSLKINSFKSFFVHLNARKSVSLVGPN